MSIMIKLSEKRKKLVVFASILFVFLIVLGISYTFIKETPRYSLYWFKKAMLERDAEGVLKYLDTDSIADNMVKDMSVEGDEGKLLQERSMKNIGRDIVIQNLPAIKEQLRDQLKSFITSYNDQAILDNLKKANVFGLNITMEGDSALVKIRGRDKVVFKMAKSPEGHWRIIALNLKELVALGSK